MNNLININSKESSKANEVMRFEGNDVEVLNLNGKVLFNPYHVGRCLDLTESATRMAMSKMNGNQVAKLKNSDVKDIGIRKLNNAGENFLTESGVYKLIFRSNKPSAEKFQDWVTDEVLPAIRETGSYRKEELTPMQLLENHFRITKEHDSRLFKLENNMVIDHGQAVTIKKLVNERVRGVLGEAFSARNLTQRTYSAIWRDYKGYFFLTSYHNTLKKDFEEARELVETWKPSGELLREIRDEQAQMRI